MAQGPKPQGIVAPLRELAHRVAGAGLSLLFPPSCAGCGRLGELFCPNCAQTVERVPQPVCARCGLAQSVVTLRCANCARHGNSVLTFTRAAALHTWPLREAIHAFKYEKQPELAPLLARYLVAVYAEAPWSTPAQPITAVVPVPLHEQRLAERGYNQSELLAAHFCRAAGLPLQPGWLARTRETRQQVGLGPNERSMNVSGAFAAVAAVAGQSLLLVDDVYTTGSTLRACAAAALAAGAAAVYGLTLAQPVRRPHPAAPVDAGENDEAEDGVAEEAPWWEGEL